MHFPRNDSPKALHKIEMNTKQAGVGKSAAVRCARCGNAVAGDDFCADCLDFFRSLNDQNATLAARASSRQKHLFSANSK
jgi:hypothetical protein